MGLSRQDREALHRGHYAVFAEQDCPAEQRAVGLLFGRNKDNRARHNVALVGGNQRNDWHIGGYGDFLLAALIADVYRLPVGALYLVGDGSVGHHAGRAEVPRVMTLAEPAETFREHHNFNRA